MSKRIYYEWDIETYDEDGCDIIDHNHADSLNVFTPAQVAEKNSNLVLVRQEGSEANGITDRTWAYVSKLRTLPDNFEDSYGRLGAAVPARFHKELKKFYNK